MRALWLLPLCLLMAGCAGVLTGDAPVPPAQPFAVELVVTKAGKPVEADEASGAVNAVGEGIWPIAAGVFDRARWSILGMFGAKKAADAYSGNSETPDGSAVTPAVLDQLARTGAEFVYRKTPLIPK